MTHDARIPLLLQLSPDAVAYVDAQVREARAEARRARFGDAVEITRERVAALLFDEYVQTLRDGEVRDRHTAAPAQPENVAQ